MTQTAEIPCPFYNLPSARKRKKETSKEKAKKGEKRKYKKRTFEELRINLQKLLLI